MNPQIQHGETSGGRDSTGINKIKDEEEEQEEM